VSIESVTGLLQCDHGRIAVIVLSSVRRERRGCAEPFARSDRCVLVMATWSSRDRFLVL